MACTLQCCQPCWLSDYPKRWVDPPHVYAQLMGLTYTISSAVDWEFQETEQFCSFHHDLFHASLTAILGSLHAGMTTPEVTMCPDGHFQRVVYGIGPYIVDYPEQIQLTEIVQGWCPQYVSFWLLLFQPLTIFEFRCHGPWLLLRPWCWTCCTLLPQIYPATLQHLQWCNIMEDIWYSLPNSSTSNWYMSCMHGSNHCNDTSHSWWISPMPTFTSLSHLTYSTKSSRVCSRIISYCG